MRTLDGVKNYKPIQNGSLNLPAKHAPPFKVHSIGHLEPWSEVRYAPSLCHNLISHSQLFHEDGITTVTNARCKLLKPDGKILATGELLPNNLYKIAHVYPNHLEAPPEANRIKDDTPLLQAHFELRHVGIDWLRETAKRGQLPDVSASELKKISGNSV